MNCPKCGKTVIARYKFCGFCGASLIDEEESNEEDVIIVSKPKEETIIPEMSDELSNGSVEEQEPIDVLDNNEEIEHEDEDLEDDDEESDEEELDDDDEYSDELLAYSMGNNEDDTSSDESTQENASDDESDEESDEDDDEEVIPVEVEELKSEDEEEAEPIENEKSSETQENTISEDQEPEIIATPVENDSKDVIQEDNSLSLNEESVKISNRRFIELLIVLASLTAIAGLILISIKDLKNIVNVFKDVIKTYKNVKIKKTILLYVESFMPLLILGVSLIGSFVGLIKGMALSGKDTDNTKPTKSLGGFGLSAIFSFTGIILLKSYLVNDKYIKIGSYLSYAAIGLLLFAALIDVFRMTINSKKKFVTLLRALFDLISIVLLIGSLYFLSHNLFYIGNSKFKLLDIFSIVVIDNAAKNDTGYIITGLAYLVFVLLFILFMIRLIGKKFIYDNSNKMPYKALTMFLLALIVFDFISTNSNSLMNGMLVRKEIYYILFAIAASAIAYMIKQLFSDIEDSKKSNIILKRLGMALMFGVSVTLIVINLMNGFSKNRLYFSTVFEGINNLMHIHTSILCVLTVLSYFIGVKEILASFEEKTVEKSHSKAAAGTSLVFAAFFVSATFKFVDYVNYVNNVKIKGSELLGMAIFAIFAVLMVIFQMLKYKKSAKKLICSIIEVLIVMLAIIFIFRFKLKDGDYEVGFIGTFDGWRKMVFYALPIFAFILVALLSRKVYALITLEKNKSYAGIYFLSAIAYAICMVILFLDLYDAINNFDIIIKNLSEYVKKYLDYFVVSNYFGIVLLLAGMIISLIFKMINKEKKIK